MAFIKKYTFLCSMLYMVTILACTTKPQHNIQNKAYCSQTILSLAQQDQEIRKRALLSAHQQNISVDQAMKEASVHIRDLDDKNTLFMKKVIETHGWPTLSQFGQDVCMQAWLIVQHSHDIDFQEQCLSLMQKLPLHEIEQQWIAYLYDRIKINRNKPQRYGTQLDNTGNPYPIDDENDVDELRKSVGLEPLQEYILKYHDHMQQFIKS